MKSKLLPLLLLAFASTTFAADEFTKNGDGTVTHNPTGLILKMCAEGQTWDGSFGICNGTAATYAAADALKLTGDFAGKTDWRLPTKEELKAIGEGVKFSTSLNANFTKLFFPQTPTSYFLSSTDGVSYFYGRNCPDLYSTTSPKYCAYTSRTYYKEIISYGINGYYTSSIPYTTDKIDYNGEFIYRYEDNYYELKSLIPYSVLFSTGEYSPSETTTAANNVRLIRGTQWFGTLPKNTQSTLITDFLNNQDGTVTHTKTGLTWQRCAVGQTWNEIDCSGTATPLTYEKAMALTSNLGGNTDWRLPSFQELRTLIDKDNKIETFVFPHAPTGKFWSSVNYTGGDKSNAFYVSFNDSYAFYAPKTTANLVRLVRDTPLPGTITEFNSSNTSAPTPVILTSVDLSTTLSASTNRIQQNTNITYTATVINNGTGAANNSLLKIYLPPRNVSIVSMPSDCVTIGKSLTCSLGSLAAGANASRAITVTYTKSGGASVSALALTDSADTNSANNVSRLVTAIKK